jgi:hypothetical protein
MSESEGLATSLTKIVDAIARVLQEEGKAELGAMLSEASMKVEETSFDNWNGGTYGYTLQLQVPARTFAALGSALDEIEEDLKTRISRFARLYPNEHVEAVVIAPSFTEDSAKSTARATAAPSFWPVGYFRLFLSHVSTYKAEASELARHLSDYGVAGFVAHEDIEPTKEWEDEIRLALTTCDALACLLTDGFQSSKWTDQEVGFSIGRGTLVLPIRLGLDPYGFMARHQGYSGYGASLAQMAEAVVKILAKHDMTRAQMALALVTSFEQSDSFATAKRRVANLEIVSEWNSELVERVSQAATHNGQIAHAFGVPERVGRLLSTLRGRVPS